LKKMRDGRLTSIYHSLYMLAKGNHLRTRSVLIETIPRHEVRQVTQEKTLADQSDARKDRAKSRLERRCPWDAKKMADAGCTTGILRSL
jgi:hypothetical protein